MKDSTTIDKMINTKMKRLKNVELPKDANVSVNKEDFVMLLKMKRLEKLLKLRKLITMTYLMV